MAAEYFAWRDPDTGVLTFWQRHRESGLLFPWPKGAWYGPRLHDEPGLGREYVVPFGLSHTDRSAWRSRWASDVKWAWQDRAIAAVEADPVAASALFAKAKVRCNVCGRRLTDLLSREVGMGPECRDGMPEEQLAAARDAVRRTGAAANPDQL